jgi:hypothetical protein
MASSGQKSFQPSDGRYSDGNDASRISTLQMAGSEAKLEALADGRQLGYLTIELSH